MSVGSLNSSSAVRVRMMVPAWGIPFADVELAEEVALEAGAAAELVVADADFVGTIVSGGVGKTGARYRVVAGAGGWGKTTAARSYVNDGPGGVKKLTVLRDAAEAVGETLDTTGISGSVGPAWDRLEEPASAVVELVAPQGWYVGLDGVTRIGRRPVSSLPGEITRTEVDAVFGRIVLASDTIASIVPGVVVDGVEAFDVEHELTPTTLRSTIWGARGSLSNAWVRLVNAILPELRYQCPYEFRVISQSGERLNLQPVRSGLGLPILKNVRVRPGIAGARATVTPGSTVVVQFLNADPARPYVSSYESPDAAGWMPVLLELGEGPTFGIARMTDAVVAGPFGGTIVGGSVRVKAGL